MSVDTTVTCPAGKKGATPRYQGIYQHWRKGTGRHCILYTTITSPHTHTLLKVRRAAHGEKSTSEAGCGGYSCTLGSSLSCCCVSGRCVRARIWLAFTFGIWRQPEMAGAACNAPGSVSLWASDILDFSSEYNTGADGWGARAALGPPRVYPKHGDITGAWAPGNITNNEHITLKFAEALYVDQLEVYETYNPGGISRVVARTESGEWVPIYTAPGPPVLINHSRIFDVPMQPTSYRTDTLKIVLDCSAADTWVEIDAVKMTGVISRLDSPPPMTKLSDDLFNLVDCEDFSDVTFEVEGHTVKGHRAILSARSKYFRAMFSDAAGKFCHMPSGEPVVLGNISYDAFKVMMQYLYTNRILPGSTPSSLVELIRAADMYAMEDLGKVATYELNVMMCTGNVVEIYREAIEKLPVLDVVEKLCTDCISKNLQEVSKTKAFCNLPQELMLNLIQICTANMKIS